MANIWKANKDVNEHPNRNNFDLSFQNHLTMKMGTLYPVFCRRVVPGDSFRINTAFGLKFMPMVFPVQSRMRAHMHFFYVRNKNLWENFETWVQGLTDNDTNPHPYLKPGSDNDVKTGSIHDFLGVPTTVVTHDAVDSGLYMKRNSDGAPDLEAVSGSTLLWLTEPLSYALSSGVVTIPAGVVAALLEIDGHTAASTDRYFFSVVIDGTFVYTSTGISQASFTSFTIPTATVTDINNAIAQAQRVVFGISTNYNSGRMYTPTIRSYNQRLTIKVQGDSGFYQLSDLDTGLYTGEIHLNALPYRAYESIYYAYYANSVIQPLRDGNGNPMYNKYNHTVADGADETDYHLFRRNYELDAYTSAMPSPQQGIAPLVGMTALGNITMEDENGITTAHAEVDDSGQITKVVLTSPAASVEHARTAMNIAASGMSINDFRATNALQRFLETTLRKGYRYMDFIAGHFGKSPEYRVLDMPEFIGGFSRDVNVTTTFSSSDTYDPSTDTGANLGDYVGNASCFGGSNHSVSHYCDDFGWIIGIMCVVPTPAYSQILQKQMVAPDNNLGYFFPEFNQLGLQPITYEEMAPAQRVIERIGGADVRLQDTFGYQRPYHDYVGAIDEVHGEFRGSMKDFLVNRIFSESPQLSDEFLKINPEEVNDIFVDTNAEDDTIIGQIIFDVKAKRPINRIVIPGLGR